MARPKKIHSLNLRFGRGPKGADWIRVIKLAAELAGEDDDDFEGDGIPVNYWLRELLLEDKHVKKAMRQLKVKLEHPPGRGMYDRDAAERRRLREAAAERRANK